VDVGLILESRVFLGSRGVFVVVSLSRTPSVRCNVCEALSCLLVQF
jgi:hypothetical protein